MIEIIVSVLWTLLAYYLGYYLGYNKGIRDVEINIRNYKNEPSDDMH